MALTAIRRPDAGLALEHGPFNLNSSDYAAITGSTDGWQSFTVNLSRYAGGLFQNFAVDSSTVPADTTGQMKTTYFLGDNIATTQYEVASSGWPVYQGALFDHRCHSTVPETS